MRRITLRKGGDFHCHFREGNMLNNVVSFTARQFGTALAMPNTTPPKQTGDDAQAYAKTILSALPPGTNFNVLPAIMLTKQTTAETVADAAKKGVRVVKYIPEGVSVNSEDSIPLEKLHDYYPVIDQIETEDMVLSGHWEAKCDPLCGAELPQRMREIVGVASLIALRGAFPELKIVAEHASTSLMIGYVESCTKGNVAATLTAHHALLTADDVFDSNGRICNPHNYCKPIAKRERDRIAVVKAMTSGDYRFFFGSDTAPHAIGAKMVTPPAPGIFSAPVALPLLADIFTRNNAVGKLNDFIAGFGFDFYGLPRPQDAIDLIEKPWRVPNLYFETVVPFMAGAHVNFNIAQ